MYVHRYLFQNLSNNLPFHIMYFQQDLFFMRAVQKKVCSGQKAVPCQAKPHVGLANPFISTYQTRTPAVRRNI